MKNLDSEKIINLGSGHPSLSLLPLYEIEKGLNRFLHKKDPSFLQYGSSQGDEQVRLILARFLSEINECCITPECLFITNGISQSIDLSCTLFTGRHDTIFVEEPTYFYAHPIFSDHQLNVIGIPVDEQGISIPALEEMLRVYTPLFVYIIPAFHNPTSVCLSPERKEKLLLLSKEFDFYIVSDEAYQMLHFNNSPVLPLACMPGAERVISLGSFSKICAPGLRLGWIQAAPAVINKFSRAGYIQSGGGHNPFISGIIYNFIEAGYQQKLIGSLREEYKKRAYALSSALKTYCEGKISFTEPEGGFFIWGELDGEKDSGEVLERARENGILFQPGVKFSLRGKLTNFLRLSFSHYDESILSEGIKRLSMVL